MSLYGESLYSESGNNVEFFKDYLLRCLPAPYVTPENRDFLRRFFTPSAEDLAAVNSVIDRLDSYAKPEEMPEEWLDWWLKEVFGWTLIPDGYPVARKRRLLSNLHLHYKRRYTITGVHELLNEFGVINEVYDRLPFVGGYYGSFGSRAPLCVRVRVLGFEPFSSPQQVYAGGFYGGTYAHTTRQIITQSFVMDLIRWGRAAGVEYLVEFVTHSQRLRLTATIEDEDDFLVP